MTRNVLRISLAGLSLGCAGGALAQGLALPEIVVTSPSPILTRRSTPRPPGVAVTPAPARAGGGATIDQPAPAPAQAAQASPGLPNSPDVSRVPLGVLAIPDNVFAPVTVVTRNDIDRETQRSLGDLLFQKPGISASTYAPGIASRPIVRGLDNFRVRVQENGIGVQDVSELGEDHAVPLDPSIADQIEVIRGPATLRYGSTAIGGVVAATNNRVPTFIPENGVSGRISGGVSSVDRGREGSAAIDAGGAPAGGVGAAFHVDAFGRRADDYRTPRGPQLNSSLEAHGHSFGASSIGPNGFVGLAFQHYDALYGVPGGEAERARTRLDVNQDKLAAKGEYRPDSGAIEAIRFFAGASRYKHNELGRGEEGYDAVRATFRNREYEARIEAQHVPVATAFGTLTGAFGLQMGRRNIDTSGEAGTLLRPTETRTFAVYVFEELQLTKDLKLQAAGRIERVGVRGTTALFPAGFLPQRVPGQPTEPEAAPPPVMEAADAEVPDAVALAGNTDPAAAPEKPADQILDPAQAERHRAFAPKSASLGLQQRLPFDFVATLNGQYVERAPSAPELFSQGAHDATATFEIGDPNLKKETARTVEVGIRRTTGPFRIDATGYYTRYTGFIYKRLTGIQCGDAFTTCGEEAELNQVVYSQRPATFTGAEVGAQLDILPIGPGFVGIDAQYDFVRAIFDDGTYVPRIVPHRVGAGLFYRDGEFYARLGFLHAFPHTQTAFLETPTPDYTLLRAEVNYVKKLNPLVYGFNEVKVGVVGDNLLNEEVRNSASFKKDEILLPGRNVRAYVTMRF